MPAPRVTPIIRLGPSVAWMGVSTARTIAGLDAIGLRFGSYWNGKGTPLASKAVMLDQTKAAVDARRDQNVVILIRLDGVGKGHPIDQVLETGAACAEAGADAFYFGGLSLEGQAKARQVAKRPLMTGGGTSSTPERLKAAGVSMAYYHVERYQLGPLHAALQELKSTGKIEKSAAAYSLPGDVTNALVAGKDWEARGRRYNVIKS